MAPEGGIPSLLANPASRLAAGVLVLVASACGAQPDYRRFVVEQAGHAIGQAGDQGLLDSARASTATCLELARARVAGVLAGLDPAVPSYRRDVFLWSIAHRDGALAEAMLADWQPSDDDGPAWLGLAEHHLLQGHLEQARELAWRGAERFEGQRAAFVDLVYQAWLAEPGFYASEPTTITAGVDVTDIRALGGGTSLLFRFVNGDDTVGAFKPLQGRRWSYYRGELAAYRLCPLIRCDFDVPRNREVRLLEADFERLYRGSLAALPTDEWRALRWLEDDAGRRWLHGTLEDWVPTFVDFPIEYDDVWSHWLRLDTSLDRLARLPLAEALRPLETRPRGRYLEILAHAESLTTPELARLISNLHVFDYLVGNWDRYSELTYGNNNQFARGTFLSLDLGAAFGTPEHGRVSSRPWLRLTRIERFSRSMIDAIRWMDLDALRGILFPPNPHHPEDAERYELFLERRRALLDYVDDLAAAHGEDAVFVFE